MSAPDDLDRSLVRELIQGRDVEENFQRLFRQYNGAVSGFFVRKGFAPEDCRDLTQEVFVAVYTGLKGLRSEEAFAGWLFSIARHMMYRHLDRRGRFPYVSSAGAEEGADTVMDSIAASDPDPLRRVLDQEMVERVRDAIEELPGRVQDCLRARVVDGLNYREIGERLGISENTVAVHVHRGIKSLRARLKLLFAAAPSVGDL